jgi:predicted Zn-ribbon and HTH transcriptional regulator
MKEKVTVSKCKCEKCGYEWTSKSEHPYLCPHCRTAKWNVPRENTDESLEKT